MSFYCTKQRRQQTHKETKNKSIKRGHEYQHNKNNRTFPNHCIFPMDKHRTIRVNQWNTCPLDIPPRTPTRRSWQNSQGPVEHTPLVWGIVGTFQPGMLDTQYCCRYGCSVPNPFQHLFCLAHKVYIREPLLYQSRPSMFQLGTICSRLFWWKLPRANIYPQGNAHNPWKHCHPQYSNNFLLHRAHIRFLSLDRRGWGTHCCNILLHRANKH